MKQTYDSSSLRIGPSKTYWWFFLSVTPITVFGLIHLHEFHTYTGSASVGGLLGLSIGSLILGGSGMTLSKGGILRTWYGIHLRQIPWDEIKDVCCYPVHDFHCTKVERVIILIRTNKCKGDPPMNSIGDYHSLRMRKTLFINHGDYSPAFERFTAVTYIPPKEEWAKGDGFPE